MSYLKCSSKKKKHNKNPQMIKWWSKQDRIWHAVKSRGRDEGGWWAFLPTYMCMLETFHCKMFGGKKEFSKNNKNSNLRQKKLKKFLRVCISFFSCTVNNPFSHISIKPTILWACFFFLLTALVRLIPIYPLKMYESVAFHVFTGVVQPSP